MKKYIGDLKMAEGINSISSSHHGSRPAPEDMVKKLSSLGIPADIISQGPEAVKTYADENSITLPEPPQKPENLFSDDSTEKTSTTDDSGSKGIETELLALGVPASIIAQGREAVMQYMQENGIQMPPPPSKGSNLNYES
jgi:hypothetical protein